MGKLTDEEIASGLGELPGWEGGGDEISKEFRLGNFKDAVSFVVRLSYEAESRNHHPDLEVHYNRVKVTLSTHSEGGVTAKDLDLAGAIEGLPGGQG
ncbi:MAG: 4a-hydroxytetrahydrobiopterin dehydratase [Actinomycetota bacterium]|jgi:4a-hydroxytetrahydrobiopterin dehydratase|nr:4a-hydroxytetrahydrobiopterin dehydratase [Actinomycetota bacterium]